MTAREVNQILENFYKTNKVEFDRQMHAYRINEELFTGVTSVTDVRHKDFLAFWSVKEAYRYLLENWDLNKTYTQEEKEGLLEKAKSAWTDKSTKAKNSGTVAHLWIENYLTGKTQEMPKDKEAENAIIAFLNWEIKRKPVWVASEKIVASLTHKVAGTLDSLAILDGKLILVDFKTSGTISESFLLQLFGYELCLEEMGIEVDDRIILRVPKDGTEAEELEIKNGDGFPEFCKETFLHCRQVHRWNLYIENHLTKDRQIILKGN